MKQKDLKDIAEKIFNDLSDDAKVDLMVGFYLSLDDYHKDEFLRKTDNP